MLSYLIKRKSKIFISWLFSYFVITMVVILISIIAYVGTVKVIEDEINNSHFAMLKQLKQTIDDDLKDINEIKDAITLDQDIVIQAGLKEPVLGIFRAKLPNVIKTLSTTLASNNAIEDIFIYLPERDLVISCRGTSRGEQYFHNYYDNRIEDLDEWMNFLAEKHYNQSYSLSGISMVTTAENGCLFLETIESYKNAEVHGTLGILMNSKSIRDSVSSLNMDLQGSTIIINEKGEIISYQGEVVPIDVKEMDFSKKQEITSIKIGGKNYVASYCRSDVNGWKYITIVPKSIFSKKAMSIKNLIFACIGACLIFGIVMAYFLSRKNYMPLSRLIEIFTGKDEFKFNNNDNEFNFIENSIKLVMDKAERNGKIIDIQKEALKKNFLSRLAKGNISQSISMDDIFSTYGINFKGDSFIFMLFCIEDLGELESTNIEENDAEEKDIELARFVIDNILSELLENKFDNCIFEVDQLGACIVNTDSKKVNVEKIKDELMDVVTRLKDVLNTHFNIVFTITISDVHHTINGIPAAYQECLEAMEYRMVLGNDSIINYSDIHVPKNEVYTDVYPIETQQQLINSLRAGDFDNAIQIIESVFDKSFLKGNVSIDMVRLSTFAIANTLVNAICDVSFVNKNKYFSDMDVVKKLLKCTTVVQMKEQIVEILKIISADYETGKKESNDGKIDNIIAYVKANYNDINLSVTSIAEQFDMNPVYLSRYFKEHTGEGLLHVINQTRIDEAKKLLSDSKLSIKDISEKVGFYNSTAFIRAFKKYEGITPGKFREIYILA